VRVAILTISDRASRGEYEDRSGPEIQRVLEEAGIDAGVVREIVSDDAEVIRAALDRLAGAAGNPGTAGNPDATPASAAEGADPGRGANPGADFIITTGGTGLGPRDVTPDVTRQWCERDLPGIAEAIRAASLSETETAMLSRGYAGVRGYTIVVNLPGSVRGAGFAAGVIAPVMSHAVSMLRGGGH
jgi:molybdenum cofactor biosynthesis protein B